MKKTLLMVLIGMALPALARERTRPVEGIELEDAVTGGTACGSSDSVSVSLEDGVLDVEFADFQAGQRGVRMDRQTCLFSAVAQWPQGSQIVIRNLNLRGSYHLGAGASGVARAELFTTGGEGTPAEVQGTEGHGYFDQTLSDEVYRSNCSGSGMLRLNSSIRVTSGNNGRNAMGLEGLSAELTLEPCQ